MKKIFLVALAAMSLGVMQSSAAQISGSFGFDTGNVIVSTLAPNYVDLSANPVFAVLNSGLGDFASVADNTPITLAPLTALTPGSVAGLAFTFGTFTFTASSYFGPDVMNDYGIVRGVLLFGTYTSTTVGLDATPGALGFSISYNATGGTAVGGVPTYSAAGSGSAVPEPATYAMLGSALLGLGLMRRRKA